MRRQREKRERVERERVERGRREREERQGGERGRRERDVNQTIPFYVNVGDRLKKKETVKVTEKATNRRKDEGDNNEIIARKIERGERDR